MAMNTYYVSTKGNNGWSGTLPDPNTAGSDGPWASVAHARTVIRARIADGMTEALTVLLRGGNYYLSEPLLFDERDSGRDGHTISYRNYPGETPVLNGGATLTGWQALPDGVQAVHFDASWLFSTLCAGGRRCRLARFPGKGYMRVAEMVTDNPKKQFRYAPGDVPESVDINSLRVFIWPGGLNGDWNWFSCSVKVNAVDPITRTITLDHPVAYEIGAGSRYYLQNMREFLNEPDEFFVDRKANILYYMPSGKGFDASSIVVPRVKRIIACVGSSETTRVANLCFEGLTMRNSDVMEGLVTLSNAERITICGCCIHCSGYHGILLDGWAQRNTISGNHIYDIGDTGIMVHAPDNRSTMISQGNIITNNHVHDTGQIVGHSAGIQLVFSGENSITHNRVHDTPRYSISLKGLRNALSIGRRIGGIPVTSENVRNFAFTRDNTIAFNDLSHANTDSQDTGVIEAWGVGTGNIIRNNRIHDSDIPFSFGFGIYLDDACDEFVVSHNLLDRLQRNGAGKLHSPLMIKGVHNHVFNNLLVCNRAQMVATFCEMGKDPNRHLRLERNIAVDCGDGVYGFTNWDKPNHWDEDRLDISESNIFYNPRGVYLLENVPIAADFSTWKKILGGKYDQQTLLADPLVLDAEHGDYRLRYDSPAFALGFEEIDFRQIGLTAEYPFSDPEDPLESLHLTLDGQYHWFARMAPGEGAALEVTGRTVQGYVTDLAGAQIHYNNEMTDIVTVTDGGELCAIRPGTARVIVTVAFRGRTVTKPLDVIVTSGI